MDSINIAHKREFFNQLIHSFSIKCIEIAHHNNYLPTHLTPEYKTPKLIYWNLLHPLFAVRLTP